MQQPPLLPEEVLARVLRVAKLNGTSVVALAALYALMSAMAGQPVGAIIGLLAAGAGAVELHGSELLRHGEPRGVSWLVGSQPFLLVAIFVYCGYRLTHFEVPPLPDNFRPMIEASAEQLGMTVKQYFEFVNRLTCRLLALLSIFYQGAMMLYYFRRRHAIVRALGEE